MGAISACRAAAAGLAFAYRQSQVHPRPDERPHWLNYLPIGIAVVFGAMLALLLLIILWAISTTAP